MSVASMDMPIATEPTPRLSLALHLMPTSSEGHADAAVVHPSPTATTAPTATVESPQETLLRGAITQLLQETASDVESFAYLRDVCHTTLGDRRKGATKEMFQDSMSTNHHDGASQARWSIATSIASPKQSELLLPPKSPQDRFRAFVPSSIEKGKSRYGRRGTQACEADTPRWKRAESEDQQHPITDIACIFTGDTMPDGFTKIERSPTGQRADLSKGGGGLFIYLCVNRDRTSNKLPISEILTIFPERGEFVPTDYEIVQRRGAPANLNTGTQGERIYLCFKRSTNSSIVDIAVLFPKKGDRVPYGYLKVDKTPEGHYADLNATTGGTEVCLSYKKSFTCLKDLSSRWTAMVEERCNGGKRSHETVNNGDAHHGAAECPSKTDEVRDTNVVMAAVTQKPDDHTISQDLAEFYLFPLLLACYTRHGAAAEIAIQSISQCLDTGLFDATLQHSALGRLEVIVEALTSVCHQGVKSRFAVILPFFRKVIRKFTAGMPPLILHATLKSLIFIGDFDTSLIKSVEDELVFKIMSRYEAERIEKQLHVEREKRMLLLRSPHDIVSNTVTDLIEDATDGIEVAKATEKILGVFKSHATMHSSTFCVELSAALDAVTPSLAQKNAFQLVITLTKSVSRKVHLTSELGSDREQLSIINSLTALNVALYAAGTHVRDHRSFGQLIRRLVFSTVNSTALLWSNDVFRASLTLISTLWNHYRRHLKVEFALLFEHLFLRMLRSPSVGAWSSQMAIMDEIMPWFQLPHNVVEIFLNYDMERVQQWKIFEHLCGTLCSIAEGNSTPTAVTEEMTESAPLQLQTQAISTILSIARSVMDASGHAHLMIRDARTRLLSMEHGGWEQDEQPADDTAPSTPGGVVDALPATTASSPTHTHADPDPTASSETKDAPPRPGSRRMNPKYGSTISVRMRNELQIKNQQLLKRAMEIASAKSLKKAIEYLVAMNFIKENPRDITSFLRIYHEFFDDVEMGDYLGEGDEDFKVQVRLTYVRAISFKGMTLVESLRHFLTNGGFRLPGEAQKIERMVEAFAQCFYEDSPSSFSSADTAMIIAYSIIMLNTDLHNPQVKKNKMSREQFVKNNRGIDNGKDLPRKFLEEVYDEIANRAMHIKGSTFVPKSRESSLSLVDLDMDKFRTSVARSVTQSEELMKDLSHTYHTFNFVGVDASISPELIKVLFERVWFYLLALATSILCDSQSDLTLTMHCLDLLRYCISTCLFLDMSVERRAFCNLLTKVHTMLEDQPMPSIDEEAKAGATTAGSGAVAGGVAPSATIEWVQNITAASSDDPWRVMGDIHMLVNKMKETIQCRQQSEELNSVIKRMNRGSYYLLKDTTHFIREGDLTKKCRSRNQTYRFFLFNDQLLYADKGMAGYWNPHKSLRLKLTRISDVPESVMNKHAFQISNPVKSFIVFADSARAKIEWMRLIEDAINEATKKITLNARRLSYRTTPSAEGTTSDGPPKSMPSPVSASALTATANTMKSLMLRRNSRLSSPVSETDVAIDLVFATASATMSPLAYHVDDPHQATTSLSDLNASILEEEQSLVVGIKQSEHVAESPPSPPWKSGEPHDVAQSLLSPTCETNAMPSVPE